MTIERILTKLAADNDYTPAELAWSMGISTSYCYKLIGDGERRKPGVRFLKALLKTYPSSLPDVVTYLLEPEEEIEIVRKGQHIWK